MATIHATDAPAISKEIVPLVGSYDNITFDAATITWTVAGGDTSTITDGIIYYDSPNSIPNFTITDNTLFLNPDTRWNIYPTLHIKEEPPKTYLQLPIGKRLISI